MPGGVLNLYKPVGVTSYQVVEKVKTVLGTKTGHAGTLDPFARGVLLVCWGRATRLSPYLQELTKIYRAKIRLGITTDTFDVKGEVTAVNFADLSAEDLQAVIPKFKGNIIQPIPSFSASKYKGKPRYRYAREGMNIPAKNKKVLISRIEMINFESGLFPQAELVVECSSGTYIRSLAQEIGQELEVGSYLASLRRDKIGRFVWENSLDVFQAEINRELIIRSSLPPADALYWLEKVQLDSSQANRFSHGNWINWQLSFNSSLVRVFRGDCFLGLGEIKEDRLKPILVWE
ncbi:MAG: tRNA pseudouridine55 synthase [Candidatus Atribacteria bacterium]|nr:tRNA pseudouridine55 synthase [Candidatus Atribacteria bacterium]